MTDTTFVDQQTIIQAAWCNDINDHVYNDTPISPSTTVHDSSKISNSIKRVANIAAIRSITPISTYDVETQGYYTAGDGGHGTYYGVTGAAAGTYVDNGGTIIVQTGGDGSSAWLLRYANDLNVKQFGAKGDGATDDTSAISKAINSGRRIYFPPGTYIVSTIYKSALSFLSLYGDPGLAIIKKKAGSYGTNVDGAISGIFDFVSCSYITLSGLKFDGNKASALPSGGTHLNGVNFYLCTLVRTLECEFVNVEFQGLNHQCTNQAFVTGNKFISCGWSGVGFTGGYFTTYGAYSCVISDNYFESIWAGVQCQISTAYVSVDNNVFKNSSVIFAQDVQYAHIIGNTFDGASPSGAQGEAPQDAITIESDSNISITGNTINAPARHGIYVVGSYLTSGPKEGLLTCNNITIDGNVISNTVAQGIEFDPGSAYTYSFVTHTATSTTEANYTYAQNGVISNNIITASGNNGVVVGICSDVLISSNSLSNSLANGLVIGSSKGVFVKNNAIKNSGRSVANTYDAIALNGTVNTLQNIVIDGNLLFDDQAIHTQRSGIYNPNAAADLKALDNIFKNNFVTSTSSAISLPFDIQTPALLNGATAFGGGFEAPGYYIDNDGIVHLRGMVLLGVAGVGASMFTLPVGMRPRADEMFVVIANSALGRCDVKSATGDVVATAGTNSQFFNLSGISFAANR